MKLKNCILVLLFSYLFQGLNAQKLQKDRIYVFDEGSVVTVYDVLSDKILTKNKEIAQSGWKFKIDKKYTGGYIIKFLKWDSSNNDNDEKNNLQFVHTIKVIQTVDDNGKTISKKIEKPIYFFIDDNTFENSTLEFEPQTPLLSFVTGAVTVPIKIRPGSDERDSETGKRVREFDFTNDINIGISAGLKIRIDNKQRSFLNLLGGISLTSVSVDEQSTKGFLETKTNASSITFSLGLIFQYDDFQIGALVGWDRLSRELGDNWVYQGKNWIGLGLGYSIFSTKDRSNTND